MHFYFLFTQVNLLLVVNPGWNIYIFSFSLSLIQSRYQLLFSDLTHNPALTQLPHAACPVLPLDDSLFIGGGRVVRRCCVSYITGASQLILAYSWARPAILVVGKGRGGMFLFLFLHFLSCSIFFPVPLFHLLYSLFYLFSPFLWETTQNDPQGLTCR